MPEGTVASAWVGEETVAAEPRLRLGGREALLLDRRYRRLFANAEARRRFGARFAPRLDGALWRLLAAERVLDRAQGHALRRLRTGECYQRLGFVRWEDYVRERLGIERRWAQELMRLDRGCEKVPELGEALDRAELSVSKVMELLGVLDADTPIEERRRWIKRARELSVRVLRREVKEWRQHQPEGGKRKQAEGTFP